MMFYRIVDGQKVIVDEDYQSALHLSTAEIYDNYTPDPDLAQPHPGLRIDVYVVRARRTDARAHIGEEGGWRATRPRHHASAASGATAAAGGTTIRW